MGNIRLSYSDADGNGSINASTEILQELNYYPGGLIQKGYNNVIQGTENKYKTYQGQELEEELGKDTYAFQWRDYDPAILRFNKMDRFAEKYYDQSPYSFSQNNPIRFVEVSGDSIWIRYKKERIRYEDGKLYNKDGTAYNGKGLKTNKDGTTKLKGFLGSAVSALDKIRSGGDAGNELVGNLQDAGQHIFIGQGQNSTSVFNVSWNPSNENGGTNQLGSSKRPSFIGLAHELGHAHDWLDGSVDQTTIGTIGGKSILGAEYNAMHWENRIRGENGVSLRTRYGTGDNGNIVGQALDGNGNSLRYTQSQTMPTIQWKVQGSSLNGTFKVVPVSGSTTILVPFKYN